MTKEEYDEIPIKCCSTCLWLGEPEHITLYDQEIDYCPHCGSTETVEMLITDWEKAFENKYKQGKYLKLKKPWRKIMEEQMQ